MLSLEIISAGVKLDFTIIDAKAHLFTDGGITVNSFCTRSGHIYSPMLRKIYLTWHNFEDFAIYKVYIFNASNCRFDLV